MTTSDRAAFHEAGHAVVADALRHGGIEAWLGDEPGTIWDPWADSRADRRHDLVIRMAGPEAEALRFGDCAHDRRHEEDALRKGHSPSEIGRARRLARRLLKCRWPEVERVAGVLLETGRFRYED